MRIRRRPQPSSLQAAAGSDLAAASTAPQTPLNAAARNRGGWLLAAGGEDEDREAKLPHASSADLVLGQKSGVARRLALPQVCLFGLVVLALMEEMTIDLAESVAFPVAPDSAGRQCGGGLRRQEHGWWCTAWR